MRTIFQNEGWNYVISESRKGIEEGNLYENISFRMKDGIRKSKVEQAQNYLCKYHLTTEQIHLI